MNSPLATLHRSDESTAPSDIPTPRGPQVLLVAQVDEIGQEVWLLQCTASCYTASPRTQLDCLPALDYMDRGRDSQGGRARARGTGTQHFAPPLSAVGQPQYRNVTYPAPRSFVQSARDE